MVGYSNTGWLHYQRMWLQLDDEFPSGMHAVLFPNHARLIFMTNGLETQFKSTCFERKTSNNGARRG